MPGVRGDLPVAEGDAAFGQVVGGQLQGDLVARQHANAVAAQPSRQMGQHDAVMVDLDAEFAARELFQNRTGYFDIVFFTHRPPWGIRRRGATRFLGRPRPHLLLAGRDVGCLQPPRTPRYFALPTGAFLQASVTFRLDGREMHEDVFSVLPLDEAVSFGRTEKTSSCISR